jgi:transposase
VPNDRPSYEELVKINAAQQRQIELQRQQITLLKYELEQLKKSITGPKSERFIPTSDSQTSLFMDDKNSESKENTDVLSEQPSKAGKKKKPGKQPKRSKMPSHLPVQEITLEPPVDTTEMEKIGHYESWKYTIKPPEISIVKTIRPKYKDAAGSIHIAELNEAFPKTNFDAAFIAYMIIQKFMYHLPIYRQVKMYAKDGLSFSRSTLNSGVTRGAAKLSLLYELLKTMALQSNYLQADESSIPVLTKDKPGSTLKGCMLVKLAPNEKLVVFDYIKTKEKVNILSALEGFSGHLQVDGNVSYKAKGKQSGVTLMHCLVHSRRKFIEAQDYDREKADHVLGLITNIYKIERKCKEDKLDPELIQQRRQESVVPIFNQIKTWLDKNYQPNLPVNPLQSAIRYMLHRWDGLIHYTTNGNLLPDNNLIENQIRPLALGRKNYMFCGSHYGAGNAAILYSFLGTCKLNNIDPFQWLTYVFDHIDNHDINKLHQLLPISDNKDRFSH